MTALREKAQRGERITSKDIPAHWSDVREILYQMHYGKCCFCERKRDKAREPDVEHYRPKAGVAENRSHPGYWWLAYDWNNLLWSCKACNEDKKGNHFPLSDENSRVGTETGDLSSETPLLLNPAMDDCERCLLFEWQEADEVFVKMHAKDGQQKGNETIGLLDLNRLDLLRERGFYLQHVLKPIAISLVVAIEQGFHDKKHKSIADLKKMISPSSEFAGLARAYFRAMHLAEHF
jgi:uncharacterized protein (TIGR02646 family)